MNDVNEFLDNLVNGLLTLHHYFAEYFEVDNQLVSAYLDQDQQEFEIRVWLAQKKIYFGF